MPITVKNISEMFGKDVFTEKGFYCGKISDVEFDLTRFKVRSIIISSLKGTFLGRMISGKRGVIIPFPMINSIGDVAIIKHISAPVEEGEE